MSNAYRAIMEGKLPRGDFFLYLGLEWAVTKTLTYRETRMCG